MRAAIDVLVLFTVTSLLVSCGYGLSLDPTVSDAGAPGPVARPGDEGLRLPRWGTACPTIGTGGVRAVGYAPGGAIFAVAYGDGRVALHQSRDRALLHGLDAHDWPVTTTSFSSDGAMLATGDESGQVRVWRVSDGAALQTLAAHEAPVLGLAFSPGGAEIATAGGDRHLRSWRVASGQRLWTQAEEAIVTGLVFAQDGAQVISLGDIVRFRRAQDGVMTREVFLEGGRAHTISRDGARVVGVHAGTEVALWTAEGGRRLWSRPHSGNVAAVVFSPDEQLVASAGWDGTARLWSAGEGALVTTLSLPAAANAIAFAPDGGALAVGEATGRATLWRPDGTMIASLEVPPGPGGAVFQVTFSPNGALFAAAIYDNTDDRLMVWRAADRALLFALPHAGGQSTQSFAFSPDSRLLAASVKGTVHLFDSNTGTDLRALGEGSTVLAFSPDGQSVLAGCRCAGPTRRPLRRWRVADGAEILGLGDLGDRAAAVALSPDGTLVALLSASGRLEIRRLADGSVVWMARESGPPSSLSGGGSVAFSPDGQLLARTFLFERAPVTVYKVQDGTLAKTLLGKSETGAVAFSRDGRVLAAATYDGVHMWRLSDWAALDPLPGRYIGVGFSPSEDWLLGGTTGWTVKSWCGARLRP